MKPEKIKFTKHAMIRARERKLWKYINKEKFFYEALHDHSNIAYLGECKYVYKWVGDIIKIVTVYRIKHRMV